MIKFEVCTEDNHFEVDGPGGKKIRACFSCFMQLCTGREGLECAGCTVKRKNRTIDHLRKMIKQLEDTGS